MTNGEQTYRIIENSPTSSNLDPVTAATAPVAPRPKPKPIGRLVSLDAFRGFIMLMLAAHGFGILSLSRTDAGSDLWKILDRDQVQWLAFHFDHPAWQSSFIPGTRDPAVGSPWLHVGVSFWDLIQPAFMFMVGAAMPFSSARRTGFGESRFKRTLHALIRSLVLILMGVFLYSLPYDSTNWIFPNVLAQIGLGYFFVTLLIGRKPWVQWTALAVILVGTWIGMHIYIQPSDVNPESVGAKYERGEIYAPPYRQWSKNMNAFHAFDVWFLNQFPRPESAGPFQYNRGGYQTLNFVPSMATMLIGLLCGELLLSNRLPRRKFWTLLLAAAICLGLGLFFGATCCPIVKRIWTPSWVLFSSGYVIAMLAAFYLLFDILPLKKLATPLTILGMNSILVYFLGELTTDWLAENVHRHFGGLIENLLGWIANTFHLLANLGTPPESAGAVMVEAFAPVIHAISAVAVIWLFCWWLYRNRIFLRI